MLSMSAANAQLSVTTGPNLTAGWTVADLVQNVLVGEGVEVLNVTFNGSSSVNCTAIGTFQTGVNGTNLGISSGIIMGTGDVSLAVGPNDNGGASATRTGNCSTATCTALSALCTQGLNDVALLEFDFIPRSDSIKFRYVFASEEYLEYVGQINDVFGFFISGVNPNGGMYSDYNIARLPGTNTAISINNVNTSTPAYYVNNPQGTNTTIQYDGFTTVLTAEAKVIPCLVYHLKLAIADASDNILDSGVFLEAGSLSSNAITTTFTNPANPFHPDSLYEGCCAKVKLSRQHASIVPERVDLLFQGSATNGGDFPEFNSSIYFPAGETELIFDICPAQDGMPEGIETCTILLSPERGCPNQDTVNFQIIDSEPIAMTLKRDTIVSCQQHVWLHANVTGGMPNRVVSWRNLQTDSRQTGDSVYVPTMPDSYWVATVEDSCHNIDVDTIFVGRQCNFAFPSRDTMLCSGEPLTLYVSVLDTCPDSCVWSFRDRAPFAFGSDTVHLNPTESGVYHITTYKYWRDQWWEEHDSITVFVVPLPDMSISASAEEICEGNSVTITGTGCSKYSWDGGVTYGDASSHTFTLTETTMIQVYGKTNAAECPGADSVLITVDTIPSVSISGVDGVCNGEVVELTVTTTAPQYSWTSSPNDASLGTANNQPVVHVNPSQTTRYTVNARNGVCTNSNYHDVAVEKMPISIGEVNPKTVSLGNMQATFNDLSMFSSTRDWVTPDGTIINDPTIHYLVEDDLDSLVMTLIAYNVYNCSDTSTVTVYVDHATLWAPNAFTPEENNNNHFYVKMNDIRDYHIWIFNRQGLLVYESRDPEQYWDGNSISGKKCPQGTYVYKIIAHKGAYPHEQIDLGGTVILLR